MGKYINILDDLTINKIAAGEVVERPSSVVKELLENAIDSGATQVVVDITDGGKKCIKISDNGGGILSSEVEKCFLRHATSKIKSIDDLFDLYSLGFRGEALASISAVSNIEMVTKTKEEMIGTKIVLSGSKIIKKEPVGTKDGTTITVKDLFFNTPVRAKFLKSTHAETINISDLINKLAIGNPNVRLKYINNSKLMLNTPGDNKLISVIRSIYGKEITDNLIEVDYEDEKIKISGYIGNNNIYRSNKNLQHIYINKRFVKSKVILDAINESYKSIIPINKFGVCFLNIKINPSEIDVNIHPTKLEVKFQDEKEVYIKIRDVIKNKLLNISLIGKYKSYDSSENYVQNKLNQIEENKTEVQNINIAKNIEYKVKENNEYENKDQEAIKINEREDLSTFKSFKEALEEKNHIDKSKEDLHDNISYSESLNNNNYDRIHEEEQSDYYSNMGYIENNIKESKYNDIDKKLEEISTQASFLEEQDDMLDKIVDNSQNAHFRASDFKVIGTILNTYIVLEKGTSMYLLDQHAAHEKVLYEEYMTKFKNQNIDMQMLLDPIVIELSSVDMLDVEKNLNLFMKFGFEIEIFGDNHIMVRGVPNIFGVAQSEKFIFQIIDNIGDLESSYDLKMDKIASMSCRAAIKANDKIHFDEINSLLSKMEKCENPYTCPHGRPSMVEISKKEIEKMFKRIM
ncbi:DNA mismatch repair endonuclease MutL [Intestinibacter bartlettii]|uniref:DNA mismatch repair protein MutL n=1 Tax=Intestinibacter bartlettii TaxID=261299 RepID=A0ABS8CW14_9FIRM|nr:DNA mismatch repair endonuclease MutL [Intestinibacter bartlettii]MCB5396826.1 DNA mismatch repair endonuclease MutL [Intestinibacter bartlettii]MCB5403375.1 DNA mismatch repair endonuclease MutL [Intestinibacter bartlettii]MCB5445632.1 DNA mismatch repair endonuclease MutL [Intestinibacter bartlettii]MCB5719296.1 DNA mismatch repair endonuclease MutL [Intestinibacter bartlettii]MCB5748486.1 DNA mismatch repair endonuclease MutL [Intestinibacter bartlettii]